MPFKPEMLAVLIPVITLIILLRNWYKYGRDAKKIYTVITEYDVPDKLYPAEIGIIFDNKLTGRDITAEIINLIGKGFIRIDKKQAWLGDNFDLVKIKDGDESLKDYQKLILQELFKDQDIVALTSLHVGFLQPFDPVCRAIWKSVVAGGYYKADPRILALKYGLTGLFILMITWSQSAIYPIFHYAIVATVIMIIYAGIFMSAKTEKGVKVLAHILGFKQFLEVVEKERFKFNDGPDTDYGQFDENLPNAIALGVVDEWAKVFASIYADPRHRRLGFSHYEYVKK